MRSFPGRLALAVALLGGAAAVAFALSGPTPVLRPDARLPAPLGPHEYRGPTAAEIIGPDAIGDE